MIYNNELLMMGYFAPFFGYKVILGVYSRFFAELTAAP